MGGIVILGLATAAGATVLTPATPARKVVGTAESGRSERVDKVIGYLDGQSQATFSFPGAEYVKVHFASVLLLPGDYLTVGTPDGGEQTQVTKPGWAMSVTGDTAIVQLHRTGLLSGVVAQLGVRIDEVSRGFTETERQEASQRSRAWKGREESICGNNESYDAVCYRSVDPVVYRRTKAVARLLIKGTELCTAFRVGPENRLMTNHHCIASREELADTEVWFNYQCAECGGYDVFRPTKVWGAELLATDKTLDFSVFSVTDFELVRKFGYLELDLRRPDKGEELYIPQHPTGAPTMVSLGKDMGNCAVVDSAYDGYGTDTDISYYCDTEGGSSGSPVLSRVTNKVIALHHFGGCPNSGVRLERIFSTVQGLL